MTDAPYTPWRGPLLRRMLVEQGDWPWPGPKPDDIDIVKVTAALRLASRRTRCPGYIRESIEAFDRERTSGTERAVWEAANCYYKLMGGVGYVRDAVLGFDNDHLDREVQRAASA